jgi:hypothetical protein
MSDRTEEIVRASLAESRRDSFDPGFVDRTMSRWAANRNRLTIGDVMTRNLVRLSPLAIAAVMLLAFYNVRSAGSSPAVDRLLGLTTVTVDAAYELGTGVRN